MTTAAPLTSAGNNTVPGLEDYLRALREHWLVVLTVVAAVTIAAASFGAQRTPNYSTTARVLVLPTPVASVNANLAAPQLEREVEVMRSKAVVTQALGANIDVGSVLQELDVKFEPNSDVLRVTFASPSAELAASTANQVAASYVEARVSDGYGFYESEIESLETQLASLDQTIAATELSIAQLEEQRAATTNPALAASLGSQLTIANGELGALRTESVNTSRLLQSAQSSYRALKPPAELLAEASVPTAPTGIPTSRLAVIGAFLGLVVGTVGALFADRLDKSSSDSSEVAAVLGVPVLARLPKLGFQSRKTLAMLDDSSSSRVHRAREGFRRLRTAVLFERSTSGNRVFLITSSVPQEGKSTIAANLGIALATTGARTVIVSADLRRPSIDAILGVESDSGLSRILSGQEDPAFHVPTSVEDLYIVPAGPSPLNSSELLSSPTFLDVIEKLEQMFDVVLVDSPPVLSAADATTMAAQIKEVILVVDRRAEIDQLRAIHHELQNVGGRILGAVTNRDRELSRMFGRDVYSYGSHR